MPSLSFTTTDTRLIVDGKTFQIKETLKLHGAVWDAQKTAWSLPITVDSPDLRAMLESTANQRMAAEKATEAARRAYWRSPAGQAETAAANLESALSNGWACCKAAQVVDFGRRHSSCLTHGFHKRGILYTGD
jgi:hypothetical protein